VRPDAVHAGSMTDHKARSQATTRSATPAPRYPRELERVRRPYADGQYRFAPLWKCNVGIGTCQGSDHTPGASPRLARKHPAPRGGTDAKLLRSQQPKFSVHSRTPHHSSRHRFLSETSPGMHAARPSPPTAAAGENEPHDPPWMQALAGSPQQAPLVGNNTV